MGHPNEISFGLLYDYDESKECIVSKFDLLLPIAYFTFRNPQKEELSISGFSFPYL
jgi:hypothetical protein